MTQSVDSLAVSVHNFAKLFETRETKKVELRCKLIFKEKNSRHFFVENHLNVIFLWSKIITIRQVGTLIYGTGFRWLIKPNESGNTWCGSPPPPLAASIPCDESIKMLFVPPDCGESLKFVLFHSLHRVWQIPVIRRSAQMLRKTFLVLGVHFLYSWRQCLCPYRFHCESGAKALITKNCKILQMKRNHIFKNQNLLFTVLIYP